MKRYSISIGYRVNANASKTGIKYQYKGRTDDWEQYVKDHGGKNKYGMRITDSQTKEIVYSE